MRSITAFLMLTLATSACKPAADVTPNGTGPTPRQQQAAGWSSDVDGRQATLTLADTKGAPLIKLTCAARTGTFSVSVPGFRPIGSEDRLSFGSDGEVVALVADTGRDPSVGVSAEGRIPEDIKRLVTEPMSASYGSQTSGPHAPPADSIASPFVSACGGFLSAVRVDESKPKPGTSPCLVQDGALLRMSPIRAIGTEPFWNARTDGRCVTYSTPENQSGTRIWTRVESGPMGPVFVGTHEGKPFILTVNPAVNCSDGMSDRRYDLSADLTVGGEKRRGCAEALRSGTPDG
jgi:uncharacterized membrane protein